MMRLRDERGSALIVAMVVMGLLLSASLATMNFIDRSQARSGKERIRETSFNVAEALLNEEVLRLDSAWPSVAADASPVTCTTAVAKCPNPAQALPSFNGPDTVGGVTWKTEIRDNLGAGATYYSKAAMDAVACGTMKPCTWDSNKDLSMWVRAQATVRGRTRTLVALVRQNTKNITLPRNTLTAGWFKTTNNGLKTMIDEKGCQAKHKPPANCNATDPAPIVVRCTSTKAGTPNDPCLGYRNGQVSPAAVQQGYTANALSYATQSQMKTYAVQQGTYFDASRGCPSVAQAAGRMVYVDGLNCSYDGGIINSATAPGLLVVDKGTLSLTGSAEFYGVVYMANNLPSPQDAGALLSISGSAFIQGAAFVEGAGGVLVGGAGLGISFDPNALGNFTVAGNPSVVQNSYRELLPGQ